MALGVQTCQAGAAQAQLGVFASPAIGIEAQQLAADLGHVGLDFQRLLEFSNCPLELALALGGNAQPNMRRYIFRVGAQHALKRLLRAAELPAGKVCLAKDTICLKVIGALIENMLRQTDRAVGVVAFERLPSLIVGGLQTHACHVDPPAAESA